MDYNTEVSKDFVDNLLESAMWAKGKVKVTQRKLEEATSQVEEDIYEEQEDMISFTHEDLQVVLDNLEDDALLEHTLSMLDVLDSAYETIAESSEEYDEDEEEYDEDEEEYEEYEEDEEALDEGKPARGKSKKKSSGEGHGGGKRLRTGPASDLPKGTSRAARHDLASRQNIGKRYKHELSAEEKAARRGRQQDKDYEHGTGRYA